MSEELNKPTKYFLIIFSIVLVAALVLILTLRHQKSAEVNKVTYNYFTFEQIGGMWQTTITIDGQPYEGIFRFNPEEVEDVNIEITSNNFKFTREPIYITFDPNASSEDFKYLALAASELSLSLVRALNMTVIAACTANITEACSNRSIVTCADTDKNVIYLVNEPPTQVTMNNRCMTLSGYEMDLLKSVDRMLFQWYKIMK